MEGVITLQALAERVASGAAVQPHEAEVVTASHDLIAIGMMADDVRRQVHGVRTTFVRVFEMHVDAIPASLPASVSAGEFRIVGAPASLEGAAEAVTAARRLAGSAPLTAYSLSDLVGLGQPGGTVFARLRAAGLDGIVETPVDLIADAGAVEAARRAGLAVQRLVVHAATSHQVPLLVRALELQRAVGGFRVFAPLPRTVPVTAPTTGYDDVKVVALARMLVRDIPSIQVDWPLYGPKLAQVALTMGADDVDGVAATDPAALGARRSAIEEIRGNIRSAGLEPVERDAWFEVRGADA